MSFGKENQHDVTTLNNVFYFRIGTRLAGFLLKKVTVPTGSYSTNELCAMIQKAMNDANTIDAFKGGFRVIHDAENNLIQIHLTPVEAPGQSAPAFNKIQCYTASNSEDTGAEIATTVYPTSTKVRIKASNDANTTGFDHAGPLLTTKRGIFSDGGEISAIVEAEKLVNDMAFDPAQGHKWALPATFNTTYSSSSFLGAGTTLNAFQSSGGGVTASAIVTNSNLTHAFDNIPGTFPNCLVTNLPNTMDVDCGTGNTRRLGQLRIWSRSDATNENPAVVVISGSNDGQNYDVLFNNTADPFTQANYPTTGQFMLASDNKNAAITLTIENPASYQYYKLVFTGMNIGANTHVGIGELGFYEATLMGGGEFTVTGYTGTASPPYNFTLVGPAQTFYCKKLKDETVPTANQPATYISRQQNNYLVVMKTDVALPSYDDLTGFDHILQLAPADLEPVDWVGQLFTLVDVKPGNSFSLTLNEDNRAQFRAGLDLQPSGRYPNIGIGLVRAPLGDPSEIPENPQDYEKIIIKNVAPSNKYPGGVEDFSDYSLVLIGKSENAEGNIQLGVARQNVRQNGSVPPFHANWRVAGDPQGATPDAKGKSMPVDPLSTAFGGSFVVGDRLKLSIRVNDLAKTLECFIAHDSSHDPNGSKDFANEVEVVPTPSKPSRAKEWWFPVLGSLWWQGGAYNQCSLEVSGIFTPSEQNSVRHLGIVSDLQCAQSDLDAAVDEVNAADDLPYVYKFGFIPAGDIGNGRYQLPQEDVTGSEGTGTLHNTQNDATISSLIGMPNLVNAAANAGYTVTGSEIPSSLHTPSLILEVPELGAIGWNSTTQNTNSAIAYLPSTEIMTNQNAGLLHHTPNFPNPMKIRVPTETKLNQMTVKISTTDEKSTTDLLKNPVDVTLKID